MLALTAAREAAVYVAVDARAADARGDRHVLCGCDRRPGLPLAVPALQGLHLVCMCVCVCVSVFVSVSVSVSVSVVFGVWCIGTCVVCYASSSSATKRKNTRAS